MPTHLIHFSCASKDRLPMLWSALSSIVSSGKDFSNVVVRVCYNSDDGEIYRTNDATGLHCFERHFHSVIVVQCPDLAVPTMFCSSVEYAVQNSINMIAKLDDDCFYFNLHAFLHNSVEGYNCMCFWDQSNAREYPDWFEAKTLSWQDKSWLTSKYGEASLWAQRWNILDGTYPTLKLLCPVNASIFCVRALDLYSSSAYQTLLSIPPKTRGMDSIVPLAFTTRTLHPYAYGEHYGIWRPQLDKTYWTGYIDNYSVKSGWQK